MLIRPGEHDFWSVPRLWAGETAFVIGGGASLSGFDFNRLSGQRCIAVNAAGYDVPWADYLFFTDHSFFANHRRLIDDWKGGVVTISRAAKAEASGRLLRPHNVRTRDGFATLDGKVRSGRSSGQTAVALAVALGCTRVVLLGFDMKADAAGRTHYHARYERSPEQALLDGFRDAFAGWRADAQQIGCAIVNATPGSALREFPMVDIDDELGAGTATVEATWRAMF